MRTKPAGANFFFTAVFNTYEMPSKSFGYPLPHMARPRKNVRPVNMTIPVPIKTAASRIAYRRNLSLSQLVTQLLEARIQEETKATQKAA